MRTISTSFFLFILAEKKGRKVFDKHPPNPNPSSQKKSRRHQFKEPHQQSNVKVGNESVCTWKWFSAKIFLDAVSSWVSGRGKNCSWENLAAGWVPLGTMCIQKCDENHTLNFGQKTCSESQGSFILLWKSLSYTWECEENTLDAILGVTCFPRTIDIVKNLTYCFNTIHGGTNLLIREAAGIASEHFKNLRRVTLWHCTFMYVEHEGKSAVVMHRSGSGSSIYVSHPLLLVPLDTRAGP